MSKVKEATPEVKETTPVEVPEVKEFKFSDFKVIKKLVKVTLDDEAIIEAVGGSISFWTWNHVDFDEYVTMIESDDLTLKEQITLSAEYMFNEDGTKMIENIDEWPQSLLILGMRGIANELGKLESPTGSAVKPG